LTRSSGSSLPEVSALESDIQLRARAQQIEPVLRLGKNGITENVYGEIDKLLRKRKLIKIKVLKNCAAEIDMEEVARKSGARLVEKKGSTFVLFRN